MLKTLSKATVALALLISTSVTAQAYSASPLPSAISSQWQLELMGQTTLRRLGLHIYDASFWMQMDRTSSSTAANLCALSITYARNIKVNRLLSSTNKEWKRLGFANRYPLETWLGLLRDIWPDIEKGDQLVVVSIPGGETIFFDQDKKLGTVQDPKFGPAFLAIWLDEKSRYQKNRKELLGE